MRSLGIYFIILLAIVIVWLVFLMPVAINNIENGFDEYVKHIPVADDNDKRHASYDAYWSFTPPVCELQNFKIQGMRGEWNEHIFFDPLLDIDYIRFDAIPLMTGSKQEVIQVGKVNFSAKIHYITLMKMFSESNPNFRAVEMGQVGQNMVELKGNLADVQSEVTLTGSFKVGADGSLKMDVLEIVDFLDEKVMDARKRDKVLNALDTRWYFQIMGVDLNVSRAAVSEMGVYIEANGDGELQEKLSEDT